MRSFVTMVLLFTMLLAANFDNYWLMWIKMYNKNYVNKIEYMRRKNIFLENLDKILSHNLLNDNNHKKQRLGINQFSDLTFDEFKNKQTIKIPKHTESQKLTTANINNSLPDSINWNTKGALTPIKNQGICGSCWANAFVEETESAWFLKSNKLLQLSVQQVTSCTTGNETIELEFYFLKQNLTNYVYIKVLMNSEIYFTAQEPYTLQDNKIIFNNIGKSNDQLNQSLTSAEITLISTDYDLNTNKITVTVITGNGNKLVFVLNQNGLSLPSSPVGTYTGTIINKLIYGCSGGLGKYAQEYIKDVGCLESAEAQAQINENTGQMQPCTFNKSKCIINTNNLVQHAITPNNSQVLKSTLSNTPVAISIAASNYNFMYYSSGILTVDDCPNGPLDHAVQATGYGTDNGVDYWIVRNSWGTTWGDKGFVKFERGEGINTCGILDNPYQLTFEGEQNVGI